MKKIPQQLINIYILFAVLLIVSLAIYAYTNAHYEVGLIIFSIIMYAVCLFTTLIFYYPCTFYLKKNGKIIFYLSAVITFSTLYTSLLFMLFRESSQNEKRYVYGDISFFLFVFGIFLLSAIFIVSTLILNSIRFHKYIDQGFEDIRKIVEKSEINNHKEKETYDGNFKNIIHSIHRRVDDNRGYANLMLGVISIIVILGSFLSIGTVAYDQYKKVGELNELKQSLLSHIESFDYSITGEIKNKSGILLYSESDTGMLHENLRFTCKRLSDDINLASSSGLKADLAKGKSQKENISELAMRISLAVLTVFLVQIFFNVYKYFQGQKNFLENKLEVIYLYLDSDVSPEQKKILREHFLKNFGSSPIFGRDPSTPIEHAFKLADKIQEKIKK